MTSHLQTITTFSLLLEVRVFIILVMLWARDWVLCRDTLAGRAATVARFIYRDTESVGEGDKQDNAAVQI